MGGVCDPSLLPFDVTSLDENDELISTPLYIEDIHLEQQQDDLLETMLDNPMRELILHRSNRRYSFEDIADEPVSAEVIKEENDSEDVPELHDRGISKHLERYRSMANYKAHMLNKEK